jgi:hypothetical protein
MLPGVRSVTTMAPHRGRVVAVPAMTRFRVVRFPISGRGSGEAMGQPSVPAPALVVTVVAALAAVIVIVVPTMAASGIGRWRVMTPPRAAFTVDDSILPPEVLGCRATKVVGRGFDEVKVNQHLEGKAPAASLGDPAIMHPHCVPCQG